MNISDLVMKIDFEESITGNDILNAINCIENSYCEVNKNTIKLGIDIIDSDLSLFRIELGSYVWKRIFGKEIKMPSPSMEFITEASYKNIALRFYLTGNMISASADYDLDEMIISFMLLLKEMLQYALKKD